MDLVYLQGLKCKKTVGCMYSNKKAFNVRRHEESCTNETRFNYRQVEYGQKSDVRSRLISDGVIPHMDNSQKRFISFDIERVNNDPISEEKTVVVESRQEPMSIGKL